MVSEINNTIKGYSGTLDLNLSYDKNTQEIRINFHYRDLDWLFIEKQESFMFLFESGDILELSPSGKIYSNVDTSLSRPEIIEEWGQVVCTPKIIHKILQEEIIGVRINGNRRYKEYDMGMGKFQKRWRRMFTKYPEMLDLYN